jgi:hypothetical protein
VQRIVVVIFQFQVLSFLLLDYRHWSRQKNLICVRSTRQFFWSRQAEGYCAASRGKVATHFNDQLALFMGNKKCRLKRKMFEQASAVHEALHLEGRDI